MRAGLGEEAGARSLSLGLEGWSLYPWVRGKRAAVQTPPCEVRRLGAGLWGLEGRAAWSLHDWPVLHSKVQQEPELLQGHSPQPEAV